MNIININEAIESRLSILNAEAGGEADIYVDMTSTETPYLHIKSWSGSTEDGMVEYDEYDADMAADALCLDGDLYWAWFCGEDGDPTLCSFNSEEDRNTWIGQINERIHHG